LQLRRLRETERTAIDLPSSAATSAACEDRRTGLRSAASALSWAPAGRPAAGLRIASGTTCATTRRWPGVLRGLRLKEHRDRYRHGRDRNLLRRRLREPDGGASVAAQPGAVGGFVTRGASRLGSVASVTVEQGGQPPRRPPTALRAYDPLAHVRRSSTRRACPMKVSCRRRQRMRADDRPVDCSPPARSCTEPNGTSRARA
jgi:hypothetical protein